MKNIPIARALKRWNQLDDSTTLDGHGDLVSLRLGLWAGARVGIEVEIETVARPSRAHFWRIEEARIDGVTVRNGDLKVVPTHDSDKDVDCGRV